MKEKIINIGIHLFDEKGFRETSVQEIVDQIGVTKGTFYYYFESKQNLLKEIILLYIDDLIKQQEEILADEQKDYSAKLVDIVYMVVSNIKTKKRCARIFFREMRHLNEKDLTKIKKRRNDFRENYQRLVVAGIANGEFSDCYNAEMLTFGILGITNWSYYWYNPNGEVSEEVLTDNFVNLIMNGISNKKQMEVAK
jgi:AcrR family transcriptional regulator